MTSSLKEEVYNDPNFAVICSFLQNYNKLLQFPDVSSNALKTYLLSSNEQVHRILEDLLIRLLRKWNKGRCPVDGWEKILSSFCDTYSSVDSWEVTKVGFTNCSVTTKIRILKHLLETQFDCNSKLKEKINAKSADELRLQPLGRDRNGLVYWFFVDKEYNFCVYTEEQDDTEQNETWKMIAKSRDGLDKLIENLRVLKSAPEDVSQCTTPCSELEDVKTTISHVTDEKDSNADIVKNEVKKEVFDEECVTADGPVAESNHLLKECDETREKCVQEISETEDIVDKKIRNKEFVVNNVISTNQSKCEEHYVKREDKTNSEDTAQNIDSAMSKAPAKKTENAVVKSTSKCANTECKPIDNATSETKDKNAITSEIDKEKRQRKRKRDSPQSDSEQELVVNAKERPLTTSCKSESDLPDSPSQSGTESVEECSPSKRRRDKFLRKRKPVQRKRCDSSDESQEPEKKPKKVEVENSEPDNEVSNCGEKEEDCVQVKKTAKRKEAEEASQCEREEAPTSKKGRPCSTGRKRGCNKVDIPVEHLRRSGRSTKGVRRFEESVVIESPRKREPKLEKQKKEPKNVREEWKCKKVKKDGRKKRGQETCTSGRFSETDEETDDNEEEYESSLHFSSASATEYEFDSDGEEYVPSGRNAQRHLANETCTSDQPCLVCGHSDHPELLLLCDMCDSPYHTGCLRPPLMLVPHGDWFCPTCDHDILIDRLMRRLQELQENTPPGTASPHSGSDTEIDWETLRDRQQKNKLTKTSDRNKYYYDWGQRYVQQSSSTESSSESSEAEPYLMVANRSCRQRKQVNYQFADYDELIKSAIKEGQSGASSGGGGKSMKNILAANARGERKKYSDEGSSEEEEEEDKESGKGRGKDMANIEAAYAKEKQDEEEINAADEEKTKDQQSEKEEDVYKNKPSPPLASVKRSRRGKRSKRLTVLSDVEDNDDTDEYQVSEEEENYSEDNYSGETDESYEFTVKKKKAKGGSVRRSGRRRRVLCDVSDFVVDDDQVDSDTPYRPTRSTRNTTSKKKKKKRTTISFSDEEEVDSEFYSDEESDDYSDYGRRKKHLEKKKKSNKKKKRTKYEEDSDFSISDEFPKKRSVVKKAVNYVESDDLSDCDKKKKVTLSDSDVTLSDSHVSCKADSSKRKKAAVIESSDEDAPLPPPPTSFIFSAKKQYLNNTNSDPVNDKADKADKQVMNNTDSELVNNDTVNDMPDSEDNLSEIGDIVEYINNA